MEVQWEYKEEWQIIQENFRVVVTHCIEDKMTDLDGNKLGKDRWYVYAYIYPKHPHFSQFDGNCVWQDASTALPLHKGASLIQYHYNKDNKVTSIQIWADYNHLNDEEYTYFSTKEEAVSVFNEAEKLITWLNNHDMPEK